MQDNRALWALMFGNLIIGTGVLMPAGMLTALMQGFAVDAPRAGALMFVGGLVVAIGAPVLASLTTALPRRGLLVAALGVYAAGHALAAVAGDFTVMLVLRALTLVGAAIFTPQAAATVGLLVPAERRGAAIAFIFVGWSLASVAGIPLGAMLADTIGWRATYGGMAALSAVGMAAVWLTLRPGLHGPRIDLAAWGTVLTTPVLLVVLAVTLMSMAGQFTMFTYIAPLMKDAYGAGTTAVSVVFLVVGGMGVIGNLVAGRLAGRLGLARVIGAAVLLIACGMAVIGLTWGSLAGFVAGGVLWGLGSFASNSLQQSRLVALAPALASATVALNTTAVYLGQSLGARTGGWLISGGPTAVMAVTAAVFALLALALSIMAARMRRGV
jgi:MFS transporter, DHA1 family, inner membrane transport protein